jgi:heterodisulfide reductase subunit C
MTNAAKTHKAVYSVARIHDWEILIPNPSLETKAILQKYLWADYMTEEKNEPVEHRKPATVNPSFKHQVLREPGGESLKMCFQCGTCTAGCILAHYSDEYEGPRKIIRMAQLGLVEDLLSSRELWVCSKCHSCTEVCPQGVNPADILNAVRRIAAKEEHTPRTYRQTAETLLEDGWLLEDSYSDFIEDERDSIGLEKDLNWNKKFVERVKKKYFPEVEE